MNPAPFVIRMLVHDGDPDGIRVLERTNNVGRLVIFPRSAIKNASLLSEFGKPGVYALCSPTWEEETPRMYIGQAECIKTRINQHHSGQKKKDFWSWCMFFVSSDSTFNGLHCRYVESELIRMAKTAHRVKLENTTHPTKPALSDMDELEAKAFLSSMVDLSGLSGIQAFRKPDVKTGLGRIFKIEGKGASAEGYDTSSGFLVISGSTATKQEAAGLHDSTKARRNNLLENGVLVDSGEIYKFTRDHLFTSPSAAAGAILASSVNGRDAWKDRMSKKSINQLNTPEKTIEEE